MLATLAAYLLLLAAGGDQVDQRPRTAPSFKQLSRRADEARDAKRLDEAIALYKQALLLKPNWDEGWWNLGSIAYDKDDYAECVLSFARLVNLKPASTRSEE